VNNTLKQLRAARMKAFKDGGSDAVPVAFYWDDPELLTDDSGDTFQIWFNDMIDDWFGISAAMIVEALLNADGRDVLVHLNSPGGMVTEGLSIHSTIKQYGGKVTMRVEGMAASAASFVMLAADEVLIEPNAMVMIHDAWDITIGPASEHRKTADLLDKVSNNIASMYAAKSGTDEADWRAAMLEETWYIGAEAVDAGLVDSLTEETADTDADKSTAAARWSGIFASAPRWPAAKQAGGLIRPVALIDTDALAAAVAEQKITIPVAVTPQPAPLDWAAFQTSLKGVRP
jgi:ATP-dependent protease ClpP protease subunit